MTVAIVVVSHSAKLAEGVVELAAQMAPDVPFFPAGGLASGGLGTSLQLIEEAIGAGLATQDEDGAADAQGGVVIIADLGSAVMTAETAVEFLEDPSRVRLVDAPLVEGAVAAAVAAQQGDGLGGVASAAEQAGASWSGAVRTAADEAPTAAKSPEEIGVSAASPREVTIADPTGLHARPAAKLAAMAASYDADVTVDGVDARSVLQIMSLGKRQGETVTVCASGPQAGLAIGEIADAIAAGFDK